MIQGEVRDVSKEQQTIGDVVSASEEYLKKDFTAGQLQVQRMMNDMIEHYAKSSNEEHLCLHFNQILTYTDVPVRAARYNIVKEIFHSAVSSPKEETVAIRALCVLAQKRKTSNDYFKANVEEIVNRNVNFLGHGRLW